MLSPTKFHTIQQPSCKLGGQKTNFHVQNKFKQIGLAGLINVLFSLRQQKTSKYTVWPSLNPDTMMEPRLALEHPHPNKGSAKIFYAYCKRKHDTEPH